jgi:hypothetical protein
VIVAQIAGHAQDASTVYATTHRGSGRSLDGGDSWEFPNTGTSSRGLAVSPITSAIAYMGQDRGAWIYSTTNAGDSWSQTRITDTEGFVRQIAVDPVTPSVVYATVSSLAYDPYADTSWDGLYVSTNSGGTWEDAGLLGRQISCVALGDDQTDVTVYAGEGDFHRGQTTGGLWRLDPGSSVWAYNGPANTIVTHIAVDPRDPMHVYIASNSNFNFTIDMGLLESYDGGDTWDWIYTDTHVSLLELDPQDPDVVYFSDGGGLCRSLDGGETWEEYDRHPSGSFNTLYFNYSGTPTVFAGTGEGIFRRRLGATAQLQPAVSSTLQFTTSRGTTVTVEIPVAAVSETVDLLFMEVPDLTNLEPDQVFAGHGFNLNVFRNDEKAPSYTFQSPVTVTIAYTDTDVIDVDENQLRLLYLDGQEWVDAACGPYLRNPGENWIQVPICHLSLFGLFQYDTATGALYVDDASGNDTGNCQDPAAPCQTIGYAISQAGDGDTLRVAQGTYVENPSVNIGVTLEGGYEAISWTRSITRYDTTIDGSGSTTQSVVTIPAGDFDVVLDGFTITGGNTTGNGGGVLIGSGGTVTITSSVITGNVSGGEGGGVAAYGPLTLMDSIISDNLTQDHGGAVSTQQATVHLINVLITGNETTSGNANVLTVDESDVTIINSTMADNNPQGAQAVLMWSGNLTITNSIMWNNALNLQADPPCPTCFSVTYSDIQGGWSGTGNIDTDPRFVDVASGDYDLSAGSPCIDGGTTAGAPARDIEGTPRDPAPDMGAYEWTGFRIFLPLTLQNVGP